MQAEQRNKQNIKKRIIISTSWSKLDDLNITRDRSCLNLISTNPFIGYCHENKEFVALKSDTDIILIQDTASKDKLVKGKINFNNGTDFFLHHTNTNGLLNDQEVLFGSNIQIGAHETRHEDFYQPVFEIILDNENDKLNRILNELVLSEKQIEEKETLKSKLNFLLSIYYGDISVLTTLPNFVKPFENTLSVSINFLKDNGYLIDLDMGDDESIGAEQRKHLRLLRDAILN